MLHNVAPIDYLACHIARHIKAFEAEKRKASRVPTTETIELSIDSKLEFVDMVGSVTKSVTSKMGFDEDDASWIELEQDALRVYIRDRGEGFDPTQLPDPLNPDNLLNPSGRGIFYMRTFMDEVEYSQHPEGGSVVRMTKYKRSS